VRRALLAVALVSALGCGSENSPPPGPIFTPTPPTEVATLVGAGDIGECVPGSGVDATGRLLDRIDGLVFTAGDNAYPNGRTSDFRSCYELHWGRHKQRTHPAPGNHDYEVPGAADYFTYFGSNAGPAGQGYYRYTAGSWLVLSLNSNVPVVRGSPQLDWVREELATNPRFCTVAYFHHSPFSSGGHGDHLFMRDLWREMYEAGVDVVIAAHDHMYERFAAMNAEGQSDPARGIRLFVVGTGGARLVPPIRVAPNSEFRTTQFGLLKLTLASGRYQWEFMQVSGGVADSGSDVCR